MFDSADDAPAGLSLVGFGGRYLAYASYHNVTEYQMMELDRRDFGVTYLTGFILWTAARQAEWRREVGHTGPLGAAEEARFDRWLERRWPPSLAV